MVQTIAVRETRAQSELNSAKEKKEKKREASHKKLLRTTDWGLMEGNEWGMG